MYRLAGSHVAATGVFFRLEEVDIGARSNG
jgi:hypothetical protein